MQNFKAHMSSLNSMSISHFKLFLHLSKHYLHYLNFIICFTINLSSCRKNSNSIKVTYIIYNDCSSGGLTTKLGTKRKGQERPEDTKPGSASK